MSNEVGGDAAQKEKSKVVKSREWLRGPNNKPVEGATIPGDVTGRRITFADGRVVDVDFASVKVPLHILAAHSINALLGGALGQAKKAAEDEGRDESDVAFELLADKIEALQSGKIRMGAEGGGETTPEARVIARMLSTAEAPLAARDIQARLDAKAAELGEEAFDAWLKQQRANPGYRLMKAKIDAENAAKRRERLEKAAAASAPTIQL